MDQYKINLDDYKTIETIDQGKVETYLVENIKTKKKYVAKINKNLIFDEEEDDDDEKERKSLILNDVIDHINLNNPAILNIIGYSLHDLEKEPYLTILFDYMPNKTLQDILDKIRQKNTPKEWTKTKVYINLLGIAIGMKYLHSQNMIQCIFTPSKILLDANYYPHISGFESVKKLEKSIEKSIGYVPAFYNAPEYFSSSKYTYETDVYSYSIIAYELITSKDVAFNCKNVKKCIDDIKEGIRPSVSMIDDQDIVDFLQRCWDNDPNQRPSFSEIVSLLEKKCFYSKFDVDEDEVKNYIKLFKDESLNENA